MSEEKVFLIFDRSYSRWSGPVAPRPGREQLEKGRPGDLAAFSPEQAQRILGVHAFDKGRDLGPVAHVASKKELEERRKAKPEPKVRIRRVLFTHPCGRYIAGDRAGFPEDQARKYVEGFKRRTGRQPPVAVWDEEEQAKPQRRARAS